MKKGKSPRQKNDIVPRSNADSIGEIDAMHDSLFLDHCFVETGAYTILKDPKSIQSLLVGRTGAGKTAFMQQMKKECDHYIEIDANLLALDYISNQSWIQDLENLGIRFAPFFKHLWKHALTIELIRREFRSKEDLYQRFLAFISRITTKKAIHNQVANYLNEWEGKFWQQNCQVMREMTDAIRGKISAQTGPISMGSSGEKIVREQKSLIQDSIVNNQQLIDLESTVNCLGKHLNENKQKFYYILIDRLDEVYMEDTLKRQIIQALIETIRDFHYPEFPVKVIPAIRRDLLDAVYEKPQGPGFQTEKMRSFEIEIKWTGSDLQKLIEKRIDYLLKHQYSPQRPVTFYDLFPEKYRKGKDHVFPIFDYLISRTLNRPRDIISFVNECLRAASQKQSRVAVNFIDIAEEKYSKERFLSLCEEWRVNYPNLRIYAEILQRGQGKIKFSEFIKLIESFLVEKCQNDFDDALIKEGIQIFDEDLNLDKIAIKLIKIFYKTGLIKIKSHHGPVISEYPDNISDEHYNDEMEIHIHPMFYREFGIDPFETRHDDEKTPRKRRAR